MLLIRDMLKIPAQEEYHMYSFDKSAMGTYWKLQDKINKEILSEIFYSPDPWPEGLRPIIPPQDMRSFFVEREMLRSQGMELSDIYSLNSLNYRSDEFTKDHDGMHVLFVGCSITFGQGLPLDVTWPKIVYDHLSNGSKLSGFFNLGHPGITRLQILSQMYEYINSYGIPDLIVANLPDTFRQFAKDSISEKVILDVKDAFSASANILADFLDLVGSRIVYTSWSNENFYAPVDSQTDKEVYFWPLGNPESEIKNFKEMPHDDMQEYVDNFRIEDQYKDIGILKYRALDLAHPGIAEQSFYASELIKYIDDYGV